MPRKIRSNYMEKFKFVYNGRTLKVSINAVIFMEYVTVV